MAFADNTIDMLARRAAESNLVLTERPEDGEAFPRLEIADDSERALYSALSSAEAQAWLDGFEQSRAHAPKAVAETAGAALTPDADRSIRDLLVGLSRRIEDHEARLTQHGALLTTITDTWQQVGALFTFPDPFVAPASEAEDDD